MFSELIFYWVYVAPVMLIQKGLTVYTELGSLVEKCNIKANTIWVKLKKH